MLDQVAGVQVLDQEAGVQVVLDQVAGTLVLNCGRSETTHCVM